ncbi:hypothetical protein PHLCEN_2v7478 [Hermanssonia centrifuga]|uniref:Pantoate--beta-alanine ligase n=1 Tax=Hermanssonia centrifuga TaxID=98765 RepID=A0A2R6NX17_9APHY|nr:hypothetical protein PHLCEN_2v7478 [Hermanssonia centrifuga]
MSSDSGLPPSSIPILTSVASYRKWRQKAFEEKKSVGFVATMGALHDGHASLVRHSLVDNDLTVVSIFVNPAQFAPHEDLTTYPRTLPRDLEVLAALSLTTGNDLRTPSAVFLPSVHDMYPSGISQNVADQKGTFVEVKGFSHQMEGQTRPTFFRGVSTVVTKLFNIIQVCIRCSIFAILATDHACGLVAYTDVLRTEGYPTGPLAPANDSRFTPLPSDAREPQYRTHSTVSRYSGSFGPVLTPQSDPITSLALSSRNAYLTQSERDIAAPKMYAAMQKVKSHWESGRNKADSINEACAYLEKIAKDLAAQDPTIDVKLDYIEMNDPDSFEVVPDVTTQTTWEAEAKGRPVILSAAMWVGKTRLIDNIILGDKTLLGIL